VPITIGGTGVSPVRNDGQDARPTKVAKRQKVRVGNVPSSKALAEKTNNLLCPAYAGHPVPIVGAGLVPALCPRVRGGTGHYRCCQKGSPFVRKIEN
jgi:hypothetical protein